MKKQIIGIKNEPKNYTNENATAVIGARRLDNYSEEILEAYLEVLGKYAVEIGEVISDYNKTSNDKTMALRLLRTTSPYTQNRDKHQKMVSRLAVECAKRLNLNVGTTSVMASNHDVGHTFYGHGGEWWLSEIKEELGMGEYTHNALAPKELVYRYKVYDKIIGNISKKHPEITMAELLRIRKSLWIIFDGINAHNGELTDNEFVPKTSKTEKDFEEEVMRCHTEKGFDRTIMPATIEGCLIRMCDKIAYTPYDMLDGIFEGFIEGIDGEHKEVLLELGISEEEIEEANKTWKEDKAQGHKKYEAIARKIQAKFVASVVENSSKSVIKMGRETSILMHKLRAVNNKRIVDLEVLREDNELIPVAIRGAMNRFADTIQKDIGIETLRTINENRELIENLTEKYRNTPYEDFISYISTTNPEIFDFNKEMVRRTSESSEAGRGIDLDRKLELEFGAEYLSTLSDTRFLKLILDLGLITIEQAKSLTRTYVDIGLEGLKAEHCEPKEWLEILQMQSEGLRKMEEEQK